MLSQPAYDGDYLHHHLGLFDNRLCAITIFPPKVQFIAYNL